MWSLFYIISLLLFLKIVHITQTQAYKYTGMHKDVFATVQFSLNRSVRKSDTQTWMSG